MDVHFVGMIVHVFCPIIVSQGDIISIMNSKVKRQLKEAFVEFHLVKHDFVHVFFLNILLLNRIRQKAMRILAFSLNCTIKVRVMQ